MNCRPWMTRVISSSPRSLLHFFEADSASLNIMARLVRRVPLPDRQLSGSRENLTFRQRSIANNSTTTVLIGELRMARDEVIDLGFDR